MVRQARSEGGFDGVRTNPPFRKTICETRAYNNALLRHTVTYRSIHYIIPSVDDDLAIAIDRIAPA